MTTRPSSHVAVMVQEAIDALQPKPGGIYIDATLGGGTYSEKLLSLSAPDGKVLSLDLDPHALARAQERQQLYGHRWKVIETNFKFIRSVAQEQEFAPCDGIVFDLGLSSDELADASKGISFQLDGPLDMRLGPKANEDGLTAETIVNRWSEHELKDLLRTYGEERFASRIATAIVRQRRVKPILSTMELADTVAGSVPAGIVARSRIHPATKTFQALRIAVNDELASLKVALRDAWETLGEGGSLVVVSFHSLEDRIVKQTFKGFVNAQISKKPVVPSDDETLNNPRARSAKLRVATKRA